MFRRRRYRRRVAVRSLRDRQTTWIHLQHSGEAEVPSDLKDSETRAYVLVPPVRGNGQRARRVTGGVLKWCVTAASGDGTFYNLPFIVAYLPQGPMCIRFDSGLPSAIQASDGSVVGAGSSLAEPNQYILAQGIIQSRDMGSTLVSCRNANIAAGDSIVLVVVNRNGEDVELTGDIMFQFWTT